MLKEIGAAPGDQERSNGCEDSHAPAPQSACENQQHDAERNQYAGGAALRQPPSKERRVFEPAALPAEQQRRLAVTADLHSEQKKEPEGNNRSAEPRSDQALARHATRRSRRGLAARFD